MKKVITVVFGIILLSFSPVIAQTPLEKNVTQILEDPLLGKPYLTGYMQPLATAFGTLMGTGLFHRAAVKTFPHFDIGLSYIGLDLPEESRMFYYKGQEMPTVFGNNTPEQNVVPGTGLSSPRLPLWQLNLGLTDDFELMLRSSFDYNIAELGVVRLSGIGIKYGLSDLVTSNAFQIDLSVQASYHLIGVNSWLNAGTFAMNIQSSKELPSLPLKFYIGLGYEVTSITMSTDDIPDIGEFGIGDVKQNGTNGLRLVIGSSLNLYFLTLSAGYEFGYFDAFFFGITLAY